MNTPNQVPYPYPSPLLYGFHCTQCIMVYLLVLVIIKGYGVWVTRSKVKIIFIAPSLCYCTLHKFHISDQITSEGPNVCDQIAFCAFHSFWAEIQMNAGYIHVTRVITIWRLESSGLLFSPTIIIYIYIFFIPVGKATLGYVRRLARSVRKFCTSYYLTWLTLITNYWEHLYTQLHGGQILIISVKNIKTTYISISFTIMLTHFLDNKSSFPDTLACRTTKSSAL